LASTPPGDIVYSAPFDFDPTVLGRSITPDISVPALGDRYLALGSRSVREKIFLLSLIVFSRISCGLSSDCAAVDPDTSSGNNFLTRDSIIGSDNIYSHVGR